MITYSILSGKHLQLAHYLWQCHLSQGEVAIDATCGKGYDSLILGKCLLREGKGHLFCLDIQKKALMQAESYLKAHLNAQNLDNISFHEQSHTSFPPSKQPIQLITYNLGYLPGGNKEVTTTTMTTLISLQKGLNLIAKGGALSLMCYPGHPEGKREANSLLEFLQTIDKEEFRVVCYRYYLRNQAPFLIWIKKLDT